MKERIHYLDALRIFAIFCMMLLHVAASNWYSVPVDGLNWKVFNIYDSLARFCVPVMVMISGSLLLDNRRGMTIRLIYSRYIFRVVTAFIFWSMAYASLVLIKNYRIINMKVIKEFCSQAIVGHYHLWFCYMIVGIYIITPFLRKITENKMLLKYFLIFSYITAIIIPTLQLIPILSISTTLTDKINLYFTMGYSFYFVAGYYFSKKEISTNCAKKIYILGIMGTIFTILITQYLSVSKNVPTQTYYGNLTINCSLQSIAIFTFFKNNFSKIVKKEKILKVIIKISNLAFGMYLVHDFFIILLNKIGLTTTSFSAIATVPILSLIVFIASLITSIIISKIPILNKYIM